MRVSHELSGMGKRELRRWWCDGFIPEKFVTTTKGCHISGRVWMDNGKSQTLWNFVVLLGPPSRSRDEVKWAELLPAVDGTGWLSMDFENQFLKVKPLAALPARSAARNDRE